MAKIQISPEGFIVEANRMLRTDSGFKDGLEFLPFPEGAVERAATGYQYAVNGPRHNSVPGTRRVWSTKSASNAR